MPSGAGVTKTDDHHNHSFVADERQRERFLAPLARGEVRSAFAMTEPSPGSRTERCRCAAVWEFPATSPVARISREIRPFRIYDGPSEVHRWSIARRAVRRIAGDGS